MKFSAKIISLLLIVVGITFSCTKDPAYIDDVSIYDLRVVTLINSLEIYQQGLSLLINSEDFDLDQIYTVSVTSSDPTIHWEVQTSPISLSGQTYLYVNDILMSASLELPSGEYTIDILQEDTSFLYTKVNYQRKVVNEQCPPLQVTWLSEKDGGSLFSFDAQEGYLYDITFYDDHNVVIEHLQDSTGRVEEESLQQINLHKVLLKGYKEGSSIIDVYRIIL